MKFIQLHVLFFSKSNSENGIRAYNLLIFDEKGTDKTKLAPFFMAHGVLSLPSASSSSSLKHTDLIDTAAKMLQRHFTWAKRG